MIRLAIIAISGLLLVACSQTLSIQHPPTQPLAKAELLTDVQARRWWQLRFRLIWPEGEDPDFATHLLIAEQLLLPRIQNHQAELSLWRFHRRAGKDHAGHQFSFIFLSDEATARAINSRIVSDPLTDWLIAQGLIERVMFTARSTEELARLEDTSDRDWPEQIQHSWPYFIMGVSQSWLMQVQAFSGELALTGTVDYPALLDHYRQVETAINDSWQNHGEHAYLHHLNAVFGYHPLYIRSKQLRRF